MGEFPRSSLKDVADVGRIVYRACGRIGSKILCTSKARNPRYGACARIRRRKRHLFAVQSKGWREPTIQKLKKWSSLSTAMTRFCVTATSVRLTARLESCLFGADRGRLEPRSVDVTLRREKALDIGGRNSTREPDRSTPMAIKTGCFSVTKKHSFLGISLRAAGQHPVPLRGGA
jgi:hypothetical protein